MKKLKLLSLFLFSFSLFAQQNIGDFTSLEPSAQTTDFIFPSTHVFQKIIAHGDPLTQGGTLPPKNDFTGYVPIGGSSENGYLSINSETAPGGVSILDINFNATTKIWQTTLSQAVDFSGVVVTAANCSGTVTPWNTIISCEEAILATDLNADGHNDVGWCVEIDPATKTVIDKLWALGNFKHENVTIHSNERTVYQGADSNPGYLYKFVADNAQDLSSGNLYVYSGSKSGSGSWIQINNATPAQRNSTLTQSANAGATVFNGIEDVEIGPDGLVYFAVKGEGRVYRFQDSHPITGTTVPQMETFVGNTSYTITHANGSTNVPWGNGNDNLAFDGKGNLWVQQDGGNNYIWVVENEHSQAEPKVKIFGNTPIGAEPTGITFSPDFRFLFMSVMHPSSSNNSSTQTDVAGNSVAFDRGTSLVIALKKNLGTLWYLDADMDGYAEATTVNSPTSPGAGYTTDVLPTTDCDDNNANINPSTLWYLDADLDGYAAEATVTSCASPGPDYTTDILPTTDCNDNNANIHPLTTWYLDADLDGYAEATTLTSCTSPGAGYTTDILPTTDCDDSDPNIHPATTWYLDEDLDGYAYEIPVTSCTNPGAGYTTDVMPTTDCDDTNATINASTIWYLDADYDGYATESTITRCTSPGSGYTTDVLPTTDCDDSDANINPSTVWYLDNDQDGYAVESTTTSCTSPGAGYTTEVLPTTDCDDDDAVINPSTIWYLDADGDGYATEATVIGCVSPGADYTTEVLPTTDCDDNDATINASTVWYLDTDGDGYAAETTTTSCTSPGTAYTSNVIPTTDCDDDNANINPATIWYLDADNDGYAVETTTTSCTSPGAGYTTNALPTTDCDDADAVINPSTVWYLDADNDGYLDEDAVAVESCTSPGAGYTTDKLSPSPTEGKTVFYPNPSPGEINIKLAREFQEVEVTIFSLTDQLVLVKKFGGTNNIRVDLSNESAGVYFMNITSKGKTVSALKVIRK